MNRAKKTSFILLGLYYGLSINSVKAQQEEDLILPPIVSDQKTQESSQDSDPIARAHQLQSPRIGPPNYQASIGLYKDAVKKGDVRGAEEMANLYLKGQGVPLSPVDANKWLTLAFAMGSSYAADALGDSFLEGRGVEQNIAKAYEMYETAAKAGNYKAQIKLAGLLWKGDGVSQNYEKAYYWICVAEKSSQNSINLSLAKQTISKNLSPDILSKTETSADKFKQITIKDQSNMNTKLP